MSEQESHDRANLITLVRVYCEGCDITIPASEVMLSDCVKYTIRNTHAKLSESKELVSQLRRHPLLDRASSACEQLAALEERARSHLSSRDRDGLAGCDGWAKGAQAKMQMHATQCLTEAFSGLDSSELPMVPSRPAPLQNAPPCRRAAMTCLKRALRAQVEVERARAEKLADAELNVATVPSDLLLRHGQLVQQRQRLLSSIANTASGC